MGRKTNMQSMNQPSWIMSSAHGLSKEITKSSSLMDETTEPESLVTAAMARYTSLIKV
jgi:hypothetical protein